MCGAISTICVVYCMHMRIAFYGNIATAAAAAACRKYWSELFYNKLKWLKKPADADADGSCRKPTKIYYVQAKLFVSL